MKQFAVEAVGHLYFFTSQKPLDSFLRACSLSTSLAMSSLMMWSVVF